MKKINNKLSSYIGIIVFTFGLLLSSSAFAYNYAGYRWAGSSPNIIVDLNNITITAWKDTIKDAMTDWNNTGAKFSFSSGTSSNKVNLNYEDSNRLAWTAISRKYIWWGDVSKVTLDINTIKRFNPPYNSGYWFDLRTIMRHEFGHWLVLYHTTDSSTLMYPVIDYWDIKNIGSDEVNGIRAIYGTR